MKDRGVSIKDQGFVSPAARRKAVSRARCKMPRNSVKFAEVLTHLMEKASPKKKEALKHCNTTKRHSKNELEEAVKNVELQLRQKLDKKSVLQRRLLINAISSGKFNAAASLKIRHRYMKKWATNKDPLADRKKRSDCSSSTVVQLVEDMYIKPYISREMPSVVTKGKPIHILEHTIKDVHQQFLLKVPII